MAHAVFISHSVKDKKVADTVCATLEANGIQCWVAPRDILPGMDWTTSIVRAIAASRLLVLVFSSNTNTKPDMIKHEVELAAKRKIPILPLRIENVAPVEDLEFFLSSPHWLDAFTPPIEPQMRELVSVAKCILQIADPDPTRKGGSVHRDGAVSSVADVSGGEAMDGSVPRLVRKPASWSSWNRRIPVIVGGGMAAVLAVIGFIPGSNEKPVADTAAVVSQVPAKKIQTGPLVTAEVVAGATAYDSKNYSKALEIFLPLAEKGDIYAQTYVAAMYLWGKGTPRKPTAALHWFELAGNAEEADAENFLGALYRRGAHVPKDYREALRWYERAARHGHENAQYWTALMYLNGWGVAVDKTEAYAWATISAGQGQPEPIALRRQIEKTLSSEALDSAKRRVPELQKSFTPGFYIYNVTEHGL